MRKEVEKKWREESEKWGRIGITLERNGIIVR